MKIFLGVIFLLLGVAGMLYVNRRRFYRRNSAGVEEFEGYGKMETARAFETIVKFSSVILVLWGLLMVAIGSK